MKIGMSISGRGPTETQSIARRAEAGDLDLVAMGDSQSTLREIWSLLAVAAVATARIHLGPLVTNPLTRHPTVTAAAITTLDEISDGRAFLGIGRGNASVLNAGLPRASAADLRRAILTISGAMSGTEAAGQRPWAHRRVPILVHIGGPETLRAALDLADGVIFRWGDFDPATLAQRLHDIRQSRERGPRAGEPFTVWSIASTCVASTPDAVRDTIDLAHRARSLPLGEWPASLADRARRFHEGYQFAHHASKTNRANKRLMDELELSEFIIDRYALIGTIGVIADQLRAIEALSVDTMILTIEDSGEEPATDESRVAAAAAIRRAVRNA